MRNPFNKKCILCKNPIDGLPADDPVYFDGHNPSPITERGRCCSECNDTKVIPLRMLEYGILVDPEDPFTVKVNKLQRSDKFVYTDDDIVPDMRIIDEQRVA